MSQDEQEQPFLLLQPNLLHPLLKIQLYRRQHPEMHQDLFQAVLLLLMPLHQTVDEEVYQDFWDRSLQQLLLLFSYLHQQGHMLSSMQPVQFSYRFLSVTYRVSHAQP